MSTENEPTMTPFALAEDAEKAEAGLKEFHFFASSVAEWATTTPHRTLPELIMFMEKSGYPYSLFMVPGAWDREYQIKWYAPDVGDAKYLGHFTPKKAKAKKAA